MPGTESVMVFSAARAADDTNMLMPNSAATRVLVMSAFSVCS
jgi:hypothetical protein